MTNRLRRIEPYLKPWEARFARELDPAEAEHLVNGVRFRLVRSRTPVKNPAAFVNRACWNALKNERRRLEIHRHRFRPLEEADSVPDRSPQPLSDREGMETILAKPWFAPLSRDMKTLVLMFASAWSRREAAETLGLTAATLRARIHRLREILRPYYPRYASRFDRVACLSG